MKKPEYAPQVMHQDTKVWVCKVCGSYVAIRNIHDAWHAEQALEESKK